MPTLLLLHVLKGHLRSFAIERLQFDLTGIDNQFVSQIVDCVEQGDKGDRNVRMPMSGRWASGMTGEFARSDN